MNKYLETLESSDIRELYSRDDGPKIIIGHVRNVVDSFRGDATTEDGRAAIKAMARKVASVKTRCDAERKAMVSKWKAQAKAIDQRGKELRDALDDIRDEVRQPVTDFQDREKNRVDALQARLNVLLVAEENAEGMTPAEIDDYAKVIGAIDTLGDDWQEFGQKAREAKSIALTKLFQLREWKEANVEPSGPGYSVPGGFPAPAKDDEECSTWGVDLNAPKLSAAVGNRLAGEPELGKQTMKAVFAARIREDIMAAIVCKSAEQIVDAIMAGEVPHVRVVD